MNDLAHLDAAMLARRMLESDAAPPVAPADALALAWALKDLCYDAFHHEPVRAVRAAERLRALADAVSSGAAGLEIGALAQWTEGIAELTRGRFAEAVRCLDDAADALREAGCPDPAAQTQVPKIMALSLLGAHDEAIACASRAQRELLALGNLGAAARVSQNLGNLLGRRDDYAAAARHFREAAVLFARLGDHHHSILADIGLAAAMTARGDFDEARRIYARARMRADSRGIALPVALVDESQALLDLACGRYREALAGLESARRRYEALGMPQYLAIAEKELGDAYLELNLLPEALALLDAAQQQFQGLELPDEQAWAIAQRGRALARLGRTEADDAFGAAARLFAAQGNAIGVASVALACAELAFAHGDHVEALTAAEHAAAAFATAGRVDGVARCDILRAQALLGTGQVATAGQVFEAVLDGARQRGQARLQVRCLTGLGRVESERGAVALAQERFDAAIALFESIRATLPGDDLRAALLGEHLQPYEERLRIAIAKGRPAEVLDHLDRFRARTLDERIVDGVDPVPDEATVRLRERLNWLHRREQKLQDEGADATGVARELRRCESELAERQRRARLAAPRAAAAGIVGASTLADRLDDDDAVVEYGALDDELFACVVRRRGVSLHRNLARWRAVDEAAAAVRFQIDALRHGAAPVRQHLDILATRAQARIDRLGALVWAPLASALAGCRRVLVVPHGPLAAVPFGAIAAPSGSAAGALVGDGGIEVALAPSARAALRGLERRPPPPRRALAIGESSRLAHTADEARFVAALFPQGRACVGDEATLAALRAQAPSVDVLHLACHAQFRADNPRYSVLHLHDAALTADEAESLPLSPAVVVLSACETGAVEVARGDEAIGLVRAFLVAGASRVVAAQWPVDDRVTLGFMAAFYAALARGESPAAALGFAQSATRAIHPHPAFWSAFALWGGW